MRPSDVIHAARLLGLGAADAGQIVAALDANSESVDSGSAQ